MSDFAFIFTEGIDSVMDIVDDWLLAGNFQQVDAMFQELWENHIDMATEQLDVSIALLIVSNGGQEHLPNREVFYDALAAKMAEEMSAEEIRGNIGGLR